MSEAIKVSSPFLSSALDPIPGARKVAAGDMRYGHVCGDRWIEGY
jgi:hypothetical protein